MENILKNPGLQHIINTSLIFLEKSDILSFRLVNQDCKNIIDDPIFSLKKLSQLKDVSKNLIENWKKIIQNLQLVAFEIKQTIAMVLMKMFSTTIAKYPLELAYKLAESKSNPDMVKTILENSDPKSYLKAPKTLTGNLRPIHIAACFGYVKAVRTMIINSCSVDLQDEYGITPIYLAAQNGHLEIVQELLLFSANANIALIDGRTAIRQAACNGHIEIVQLLIPFTDAPNAPDNMGWNPIHSAAIKGHVDVVQLLIPLTDTPNAPNDENGMTPIHMAAYYGKVEIVKLLMSLTDNPNAPDNREWTPIHYAACKGHVEIVQLLMETTDNPNAPTTSGLTPLRLAESNGYQEIVKLFNAHNVSSA